MNVDIMRRITWIGGASFRPVAYDDGAFRMENVAAPGQRVPPHVHDHMSEAFLVREGQVTFWLGPERREIRANVGDRVVAPIGVVHAFASTSSVPTTFEVEFRPPVDMARMMAIIAGLQDEGEGTWLLKFLYVERREGLRAFSRPVGALGIVSSLLMPLIMLYGNVAGWKRLVGRYSPSVGATAGTK